MKLYLVHCGFYDSELCEGVYESHVNYFVAAESIEDAKTKAKQISEFKSKRMHVDGLQEIVAVDGLRVILKEDPTLSNGTVVNSHRYGDLTPKPVQT